MDRKTKIRLAVILLSLLVSAWYLWPTVRFYSMSGEERKAMEVEQPIEYEKLEKTALKLGLDLQGGMHLVLELDRDQAEIRDEDVKDAIDRTLEIIRNRVDQFGVAEPLIQRVGDERIIVELPGMEDEERAKSLVRSSAYLEFKIVRGVDQMAGIVKEVDKTLMAAGAADGAGKGDGESEGGTSQEATGDTVSTSVEELLFPGAKVEEKSAAETSLLSTLMVSFPGGGSPDIAVAAENVAAVEEILAREGVSPLIPGDARFHWGPKIFTSDGREFRQLFLLDRESEMTGEMLSTASATIGSGNDPRLANQPIVSLKMTDDGAGVFERLTGRHVNERLAIVLDGIVKSAPVIRQRISGGSAQIEGIDSIDEARDLAIVLRAGALPAPIQIIEERTVGPTLGSDSIQKSKAAAAIALAAVIAFTLFYYRFAGVLATVALVMDLVLILAAMAGLGATLTLPGIAGLVLTIGMAIDANVLINERIREEIDTGKTIRTCVDLGYEKAFSAILDSNVTTLITALILYRYGTGPIKGFAITLSFGILASMYTAIYMTHTIFNIYVGRRHVKALSI